MKNLNYLPLFITGIMVAAAASYCSKGSSYSSSDSSGSNSGTNNNTVIMQNDSYSKTSLTVTKGTTVTWTNNDYATHTVTADDNSFTSGDIAKGQSFTKKFDAQGTFPYHCVYHSAMKATVIVN